MKGLRVVVSAITAAVLAAAVVFAGGSPTPAGGRPIPAAAVAGGIPSPAGATTSEWNW